MATIASINPFPNDVRTAFHSYILDSNYVNRERLSYEKWHRMHVFLDNLLCGTHQSEEFVNWTK
jgi:hypothetical protein